MGQQRMVTIDYELPAVDATGPRRASKQLTWAEFEESLSGGKPYWRLLDLPSEDTPVRIVSLSAAPLGFTSEDITEVRKAARMVEFGNGESAPLCRIADGAVALLRPELRRV